MLRPPPLYPLFPYTTLFRSCQEHLDFAPQTRDTGDLDRLLPQLFVEFGIPPHVLEEQIEVALAPHLALLEDRKSTRLNSSHSSISYAVFCLKKKKRLLMK